MPRRDPKGPAIDPPPLSGRPARFFARVRALDIACPRCDRVFLIGRNGSTYWDPRTSRFHCGECGLTLAIGIIAYEVVQGRPAVPADIVPNYRQALQLRELVKARLEELRIPRGRVKLNRLAGTTGDGRVEEKKSV